MKKGRAPMPSRPLSVEEQLDFFQKQREEPTKLERQQAEGNHMLFELLLIKRPPQPGQPFPTFREYKAKRKEIMPTKEGHSCATNPEHCNITNMKKEAPFINPADGLEYRATGTVYLCYQTGLLHVCDGNMCKFAVANPDVPGTLCCPVSRLDKGALLNDFHIYSDIGYEQRVEHEHEIRAAELVRHPKKRVSETAQLPVPLAKPPRAAVGRRKRIFGDSQSMPTKQPGLQSSTHHETIRKLVRTVLVGDAIRKKIEDAIVRGVEDSHKEMIEMIENRTKRPNAFGRAAAPVAVQLLPPPPPVDFVTCEAIFNRHMMRGVVSALRVLMNSVNPVPPQPTLDYFSECLAALFANVRRVSSTAGQTDVLQADPTNLRRIALCLFYTLRDGITGRRTVGNIPGVYTNVRLYNSAGLAQEDEDDDSSDEEDGDEDDYDDRRVIQSYVLVPAHTGLDNFLPDLPVLSKLHIDALEDETRSHMKKMRVMKDLFVRMMNQPNPSVFCLEASVPNLRVDILKL